MDLHSHCVFFPSRFDFYNFHERNKNKKMDLKHVAKILKDVEKVQVKLRRNLPRSEKHRTATEIKQKNCQSQQKPQTEITGHPLQLHDQKERKHPTPPCKKKPSFSTEYHSLPHMKSQAHTASTELPPAPHLCSSSSEGEYLEVTSARSPKICLL